MLTINSEGFMQTYENPLIQAIQYYYNGKCKIYFRDGTIREHFLNHDAVYSSQYGIPLSNDGNLLFVSKWETGITAFDTCSGCVRWNYKSTRIRRVHAYDTYLVADKMDTELLQLRLDTGSVIRRIKSSTIDSFFPLYQEKILVCYIKGKFALVDTREMTIVESFSKKDVNPHNCLSVVITNARLENGKIIVTGFESVKNDNILDLTPTWFTRELGSI